MTKNVCSLNTCVNYPLLEWINQYFVTIFAGVRERIQSLWKNDFRSYLLYNIASITSILYVHCAMIPRLALVEISDLELSIRNTS